MSAASAQTINPARGEVWLVRFNPQVGAEIEKLRPAVVVSLNAIGRLPLRIVVPITAWSTAYTQSPWMINLRPSPTNGLSKDSAADAFQVKSVSLRRFERRIGQITAKQLDEVIQAVALCVGV